MSAKTKLTEEQKKWFKEGFEFAMEHAEIYEDDGWSRCAPYNDWKHAIAEMKKLLEE